MDINNTVKGMLIGSLMLMASALSYGSQVHGDQWEVPAKVALDCANTLRFHDPMLGVAGIYVLGSWYASDWETSSTIFVEFAVIVHNRQTGNNRRLIMVQHCKLNPDTFTKVVGDA